MNLDKKEQINHLEPDYLKPEGNTKIGASATTANKEDFSAKVKEQITKPKKEEKKILSTLKSMINDSLGSYEKENRKKPIKAYENAKIIKLRKLGIVEIIVLWDLDKESYVLNVERNKIENSQHNTKSERLDSYDEYIEKELLPGDGIDQDRTPISINPEVAAEIFNTFIDNYQKAENEVIKKRSNLELNSNIDANFDEYNFLIPEIDSLINQTNKKNNLPHNLEVEWDRQSQQYQIRQNTDSGDIVEIGRNWELVKITIEYIKEASKEKNYNYCNDQDFHKLTKKKKEEEIAKLKKQNRQKELDLAAKAKEKRKKHGEQSKENFSGELDCGSFVLKIKKVKQNYQIMFSGGSKNKFEKKDKINFTTNSEEAQQVFNELSERKKQNELPPKLKLKLELKERFKGRVQ